MGNPIEEQIQQNIDELLMVYEDMGDLTDAYTAQLKKKKNTYFTGPELVKASQFLAALSVIQDNEDDLSVDELEEDVFSEAGVWKSGIGDEICAFIREVTGQPCKEGEQVQAILEKYRIH
uniref:hypothetical protein n=1 Tax=Eubacterium cellulosolvens TaxID=29322 RepID=UPI000486C06D|nr:hypothetical protein [[Eubacterium] cellulosolvens]